MQHIIDSVPKQYHRVELGPSHSRSLSQGGTRHPLTLTNSNDLHRSPAYADLKLQTYGQLHPPRSGSTAGDIHGGERSHVSQLER